MRKTKTNWKVVSLFKDRANKINCKEHFNPNKCGLIMKEIAKVRFTRNCKYNINYHFVWIPKTRMKILVKPFNNDVEYSLMETCNTYGFFPLALQIMPDHLHFFVSAPPKWAPCQIVKKLKEESSRSLRDKYSIIKQTRTIIDEDTGDEKDTGNFWASGYYVGTAGHVSAEQVARYIMEQTKYLKEHWDLFDIKPFEYDIYEIKRKSDKIKNNLVSDQGMYSGFDYEIF